LCHYERTVNSYNLSFPYYLVGLVRTLGFIAQPRPPVPSLDIIWPGDLESYFIIITGVRF